MINISFVRADDPSCPTETRSVEPTKLKITQFALEYLRRNQRGVIIEKAMVVHSGRQHKLHDIRDEKLKTMDGCTVILHTCNFTLYFTSPSDMYSVASPCVLDPTTTAIFQAARVFLEKKQCRSEVKAIELKKHNEPACNLNDIPAAKLIACHKYTAIVYAE